MKKVLIIINGFFPYHKSEDYLSNELEYIKGFDEVICFPALVYGKKDTIDIKDYCLPPTNVKIRNSLKSYKQRFIYCLIFAISNHFFYTEFFHIFLKKHFFSRLKHLIRFTFQSINSYKDIKQIIYELAKSENVEIYVYSYWMANTALTAIFLKEDKQLPSIKKVFTRCHRFDVYEYASSTQYIPYRKYILSNIDKIFAISIDAKSYLENKYFKIVRNKICISRLGTFDHGVNIVNKDNVLRVVSCSWLRPIKRVHLIFEALDQLNIPILWEHYGDGEEMDKLLDMINHKKNKRLQVHFPGAKNNNEILEIYSKKHYDVFVNVSKNEGVPVSIMEAMSFGKIIIATAVGGTAEIVKDNENGLLLPENFHLSELSNAFLKIYDLNDYDYEQMCKNSRRLWEQLSNAETNYKDFYKKLSSL